MMGAKLKLPAFGREVLALREAGQRIGLLVVSVHDWRAGADLAKRENVARVVVPPDLPPEGCDLSLVCGLDVLVCGVEGAAHDMAIRGACAYRAASVWIDTRAGMQRVEVLAAGRRPIVGLELVPPGRFAAELAVRRELMLLCGDWPYDQPVFQPLRQQALARVLGAECVEQLCLQ